MGEALVDAATIASIDAEVRRAALKSVIVEVWDALVFVRVISALEREEFETDAIARQGGDGKIRDSRLMRAKLVAKCLCDGEGTRIYADEAVDLIAGLDHRAVDQIFDEAIELNGLGSDDVITAATDPKG